MVKVAVTFTINITRMFVATRPHDSVYHAFTTSLRVEDDARSMKQLFNKVVMDYIVTGLEVINYRNPMLFDPATGCRKILSASTMDNLILNFIQSEAPTFRDINGSHFTFLVNIAAKPTTVFPFYPTVDRIA